MSILRTLLPQVRLPRLWLQTNAYELEEPYAVRFLQRVKKNFCRAVRFFKFSKKFEKPSY